MSKPRQKRKRHYWFICYVNVGRGQAEKHWKHGAHICLTLMCFDISHVVFYLLYVVFVWFMPFPVSAHLNPVWCTARSSGLRLDQAKQSGCGSWVFTAFITNLTAQNALRDWEDICLIMWISSRATWIVLTNKFCLEACSYAWSTILCRTHTQFLSHIVECLCT